MIDPQCGPSHHAATRRSTVFGARGLSPPRVKAARTEAAGSLDPGTAVRVARIDGATAIVRPRPEEIPE